MSNSNNKNPLQPFLPLPKVEKRCGGPPGSRDKVEIAPAGVVELLVAPNIDDKSIDFGVHMIWCKLCHRQ